MSLAYLLGAMSGYRRGNKKHTRDVVLVNYEGEKSISSNLFDKSPARAAKTFSIKQIRGYGIFLIRANQKKLRDFCVFVPSKTIRKVILETEVAGKIFGYFLAKC